MYFCYECMSDSKVVTIKQNLEAITNWHFVHVGGAEILISKIICEEGGGKQMAFYLDFHACMPLQCLMLLLSKKVFCYSSFGKKKVFNICQSCS